MNFMFNLSGNNIPLIKEYSIDTDTAVESGQVVGITDGKVVNADGADAILGVAAEEHSGVHDELNARSDGTSIRVIISPDAVYGVNAAQYTAVSGTETSLTVSSDGLAVSANDGYAVLVKKAENSVNTDRIGTKRKISGCSIAGNTAVLTLEKGSAASEGDVYVLIPEIGGEMQLDKDGTGVCFFRQNSTCKLSAVSVDNDFETVYVKLNGTIFA